MYLLYKSSFTLLGICPREIICSHETSTGMLIEALFVYKTVYNVDVLQWVNSWTNCSNSYNGIPLNSKVWIIDIHNHWDGSRAVCRVKRPISKGYILYNSIWITFWKCQNYRDEKHINGFQCVVMVGTKNGGYNYKE